MEKWIANRPYIFFLNNDPFLTYLSVSVKGATLWGTERRLTYPTFHGK